MFDFDKNFEEYLVNWYKQNEALYSSVEDMEEHLPDIYNEWADSPSKELGNIAPREFFDNIESEDELIKLLVTTSTGNLNPCSLLMDRIAKVSGCGVGLENIITGNYSVKQKMIAINLLNELSAVHPLDTYIDWLGINDCDEGLQELVLEILSGNAEEVKERIFDRLEGADLSAKENYAEILVNAKADERTFNLLTELFQTRKNTPLYAGYLGKYGDERAAMLLYEALKSCNYLEYVEIKNAIERLGGIVEDERDFSEDIYYKAIKNI